MKTEIQTLRAAHKKATKTRAARPRLLPAVKKIQAAETAQIRAMQETQAEKRLLFRKPRALKHPLLPQKEFNNG